MPVLVIAVAALLGLLAILGLLLLARMAESRHVTARTRTAPEPLFAGLSYDQAFEQHYGLIWQIQIPALELIRNAGQGGLPVHSLKPWFERSLRSYPDLFEGHTFEEWLEFLQRSQVARLGNERILLTALGCEFLDHCRMAG